MKGQKKKEWNEHWKNSPRAKLLLKHGWRFAGLMWYRTTQDRLGWREREKHFLGSAWKILCKEHPLVQMELLCEEAEGKQK